MCVGLLSLGSVLGVLNVTFCVLHVIQWRRLFCTLSKSKIKDLGSIWISSILQRNSEWKGCTSCWILFAWLHIPYPLFTCACVYDTFCCMTGSSLDAWATTTSSSTLGGRRGCCTGGEEEEATTPGERRSWLPPHISSPGRGRWRSCWPQSRSLPLVTCQSILVGGKRRWEERS